MITKRDLFRLFTVLTVVFVITFSIYAETATETEIPEKAQKYYQQALEDLSKKDFKSAEKNLTKSLENYPDYFEALKELGKIKAMLFLGNVQKNPEYEGLEGNQAVEYLSKASSLNEKDYEIYMFLSQLYTIGYLENIELAKENIMKAIALEKSDLMMYDFALSLMDPKIDMGYLKCLYKDLVNIEPENMDNLVQYFNICHSLNETEDMIWALEKIVETNKDSLQDVRNLAVLYIQTNKKEKALKILPDLVKLGDNNKDILNVAAKGYIQFEDYKKALDIVEKLKKIDEKDPAVIYDYAFILEKLGKTDDALKNYLTVVNSPEKIKNKDLAMSALINLYLDKGDYKNAYSYCEKYINEFPDSKFLDKVKTIKEEIKEKL